MKKQKDSWLTLATSHNTLHKQIIIQNITTQLWVKIQMKDTKYIKPQVGSPLVETTTDHWDSAHSIDYVLRRTPSTALCRHLSSSP